MPSETQQSVCEWIEATFGPAGTNARVVARAMEECAELARCVTIDPRHPDLGEEAADVAIIMMRLATRFRQKVNVGDAGEGYSAPATTVESVGLVAFDIGKMFKTASRKDDDCDIGYTAHWLIQRLGILCQQIRTNLQAEVDKKMAVNRERKWELDGSGCGRHV